MRHRQLVYCLFLGLLICRLDASSVANAQSVFRYNFPASWDGVSSAVTDLSTAGNNATLSASPALSSTIPPGATAGTQSLSSANGGFHTANNSLLLNTLVQANGGYHYEAYFYWNGTATAYSTQNIINYAGTESLHLQNINTGSGTADLLFGFDDSVEGPTQSINANTWYRVIAFFDTQGNAIDGSGNLAGLATLSVNGISVSASVTKTTQGDNFNRPIGVGTLPSGSGLANFNGYIYEPKIALGLPLLGHWKMDEGTGLTAADATVLGNHMALNGATWGSDYAGKSVLTFDGTSGTASTNAAFTPPATGAVAFWMQASGTPTNRERIFGVNGNWEARLETTGKISFDLGASPFVGNEPFATGVVDEQGRWYHIVAIFNAIDDSYSVYVDGELQASGTSPVDLVTQPPGTLSFGTRTGSTEYWKGSLRDFRVYDRALSTTEIAELYGLVGHWKMDEATGVTAADATPFANNATLNGATWNSNCAGKGTLAFDGASNTTATNVAFDPPATGAVTFWMQASGTPTNRERIFGVNGNWEARLETTGKISFDLGASPFVGNEPFATGVVDELDRWYHIVAMFNDVDDSYAVYVDGELQASGTSPVNLVPQSPGILSFGTRTGSSENWKGSLRDFRVYNRWLSNEEISKFSGFLAHWNLEETSGTVAVDSSVAGNDASYVGGPVLGVQGPFFAKTGTAVELDGASTSITAGKSLLNNLSEFTVAGWIRPNRVTPSISLFGQYNLIQLGIDSQTNQIDFWTSSGGSVNASGYLPLGKWTHVAGVGNGIELKLYVNGVEIVSGGTSTKNYGSNGNFFKIGEGVLNPTGGYFDGRIDDVRVNSRALCSEEIRTLYKGGRPGGIRILKWIEVR